MSKRKLYFVSLGCPKNRVDSEVMLGMADQKGYSIADNPEEADLLVVNTCGFIDGAKAESVETILGLTDIKLQHPGKKLVVTGCLAQRYSTELLDELPEVDHFVGTGQIPDFGKILSGLQAPRNMADKAPGWLYTHMSPRLLSTPSYTAYVKIAEGCDRNCSFCAIPSFRGKQNSRTVESILQEVESLAKQGVVEVNLIAQELNGYGRDLPKVDGKKQDLATLLQALEDMKEGPEWIRLHYLYPYVFTDETINVIANAKRIIPYIDMPLQHISDSVLRSMRRAGDGKQIRELLSKLRKAIPALIIRTTFLVGFPGETDEDFQELVAFIKEQKFDRVGIFAFSREKGTPSYDLEDQVPEEVSESRKQELYEIQAEISQQKLEEYNGKTIRVLVEGVSEESEFLLQGRFTGQAPEIDGAVFINDNQEHAKIGTIIDLKVEQTGEHDLVGGMLLPQ